MSQSNSSEGGQSLMEYGLVLVLVAIIIIAIMAIFGDTVKQFYCKTTHMIVPEADLSSACQAPIIIPLVRNQSSSSINVEAKIHDPDGNPNNPYAAIDRVEFYIDSEDSSPVQIEYEFRYCMGTGNGNGDHCTSSYNISSLSPGTHKVIIKAYDTDGNVGRDRYIFNK